MVLPSDISNFPLGVKANYEEFSEIVPEKYYYLIAITNWLASHV